MDIRTLLQKCSYAAQAVDAEIFALKFGGKCLVQDKSDPRTLYKQFGPSDKTSDGYGETDAIDVYRVGAGMAMTYRNLNAANAHCFTEINATVK